MNILHLTFSPRGAQAESTWLSQAVLARLLARHPGASVTGRDFGAAPPAHADAAYAVELGAPLPPDPPTAPAGSASLSGQLIAQLGAADYLVIGTPMHNYTVPSTLKAWIDLVVRVRHTFDITPQGKVGRLRDRPVYVAVSSGGRYRGGHARQPDFLTPYLRAVLGTIGLRDLRFFAVEGTAAGADALARARRCAEQEILRHFAQQAR